MAKLSKWDKAHQRNLSAYARQVEQIYDQAAQEAAKLAVLIGDLDDKPFEWKDYPQTKERMDRIVNDLYHDLNATIENGINLEWQLSDKKNDELSTTMLGDRLKSLTEAQRKQYFAATAAEASKAFIERKTNGMNLSQNVWNFAKDFKSQLELALDAGIRDGKASNRLATQLKQYLKYPDKLFRRVRNEHGQLVLSKRAKVFHPGRGVYRSSYMNARRLAVTETNIAYRTADHERWQQLDFVVGIRVVLSNNHNCKGFKPGTFHDICDDLSAPLDYKEGDKRGLYPKDFKFTGWHPHCRCHAVPVLKTQEEFLADLDRPKGEDAPQSVNEVTDVPKEFKDWVDENAQRIDNSESLPYFIKDNYKRRLKDYAHYKEDDSYTNVAFNYRNGGLMAKHKEHQLDKKKGWYETTVQQAGFDAGNSVVLEKEVHNILNKKNTEGLWNGRKFEIAAAETATDNNIRNALKHCASKPTCEVAVILFPNKNFTSFAFNEGYSKYAGLEGTSQFKKFSTIYCICNGKIVHIKRPS